MCVVATGAGLMLLVWWGCVASYSRLITAGVMVSSFAFTLLALLAIHCVHTTKLDLRDETEEATPEMVAQAVHALKRYSMLSRSARKSLYPRSSGDVSERGDGYAATAAERGASAKASARASAARGLRHIDLSGLTDVCDEATMTDVGSAAHKALDEVCRDRDHLAEIAISQPRSRPPRRDVAPPCAPQVCRQLRDALAGALLDLQSRENDVRFAAEKAASGELGSDGVDGAIEALRAWHKLRCRAWLYRAQASGFLAQLMLMMRMLVHYTSEAQHSSVATLFGVRRRVRPTADWPRTQASSLTAELASYSNVRLNSHRRRCTLVPGRADQDDARMLGRAHAAGRRVAALLAVAHLAHVVLAPCRPGR